MTSNRATRLLHTIRFLKPSQIGWRLYYLALRSRVRRKAMSALPPVLARPWQDIWMAPVWMPSCWVGNNEFKFLGEHGFLTTGKDWHCSEKSKLWLYNLHYFDDLTAQEAETRFAMHCDLVSSWINSNPVLTGNGWEPYTLSLRIVNLVKWFKGPVWDNRECIPAAWCNSIARQAQALSAQREYHILANHLFVNGKALIFAGAFLQGDLADRFLHEGLTILDAEIPEQFLCDGGHFERSPMYHAILLWDLADLIRLAECSDLPSLNKRVTVWRDYLARGLNWLEMMCHPDGDISFFNDAAFDIGPKFSDLKRYAVKLQVSELKESCLKTSSIPEDYPLAVQHAVPSGYIAVTWAKECKALLDLAPIGPDYQPGHAHADTLSFELSLYGRRVFVNSGTSQYGEDSERHRQRSTLAHNTVAIDGENSSEVWAGFRVARRAYPGEIQIYREENSLSICGSHNGYQRLKGKVLHCRKWNFETNRLIVEDRLEGRYNEAVARYFCHPDVSLTMSNPYNGFLTTPDGLKILLSIEGGEANVAVSTWHPRFGESQINQCLVVNMTASYCRVSLYWG